MDEAAFTISDGQFVPAPWACSVWGETILHGAALAGLMAREVERFAATAETPVVRLTLDLFRPPPLVPLSVQTRTLREGRRIHVVEAALLAEGTEVAHAVGMLLRTTAGEGTHVTIEPLTSGPDELEPESGRLLRDTRYFHSKLEIRPLPDAVAGKSRPLWLRWHGQLVEGEEWSPLARVAATNDVLNGMSSRVIANRSGSINVDSTIYLQRMPKGEWIGMDPGRVDGANGIAVAWTPLFDVDGAFGAASQAALRNELPGRT
jgi:hypothetical protein